MQDSKRSNMKMSILKYRTVKSNFHNVNIQNANYHFVKSQFAKSQNVNLVVLIIFKCKNEGSLFPATKFPVQIE